MIINMYIKKLNNKIIMIPIKYPMTEYEVRILFNIGSNIEQAIESGYIHLFEHIVILEDMMDYLSDSVYFAEGYTDLDHMQIKFSCQNNEEIIGLLNYICKITEQIEIPNRIIKKAQEIVLTEMKKNKIRNEENKSKIKLLSEGTLDLPIGRKENIEKIDITNFLKFINEYLNCVEVGLIIFSNIDNEKIFGICKNIFGKEKVQNKTKILVEPKLSCLKNQKLVIKDNQKLNKKIFCLLVEWHKDIKNIILQQLFEVILKDFMKEKKITIGCKVITKEIMYLTITFENCIDIDWVIRNFVLSKKSIMRGKNNLKKQFSEIEKIGLNKWYILDEIYKNFLYNMPIIDIKNIPYILQIIDNLVYEDVKGYFDNLSNCSCKIIEYAGA